MIYCFCIKQSAQQRGTTVWNWTTRQEESLRLTENVGDQKEGEEKALWTLACASLSARPDLAKELGSTS